MTRMKRAGSVAFKLLVIVPVMLTIIAGAVMLTACGGASLNVNQNLKTKVDECVSYLSSNVYNNTALGTNKIYNLEQLREKKADAKYFVEAGILKGIDEVKSVSLGGIKFDKNQTFRLSVGNSNFIEEKAFYVEDNKLFLASPFVAFETAGNSKIMINDREFDFALSDRAENINFTNVKFQNGSTNTLQKVSDTEYNLSIKNATSWLEFYFDGAKKDDIVLTRKLLNGKLNAYGLTLTENISNYPLALYPVGYKTDINNVDAKYDDSTMDYSVYVEGKGVANAKLHINVEKTNA